MEFFTMDRQLIKEDVIDTFHSAIWTERYYGDSEIELVVEPTAEMIRTLTPGKFIGLTGSNELMMLETRNFEEGTLKAQGISICKWLNNRFVRSSALHEDRHWPIEGLVPGNLLSYIVYHMAIGGPFLDGSLPMGIASPGTLKVPFLELGDYNTAGPPVTVAVPFGPLYDALYEIATTYQIGMQIILVPVLLGTHKLQFRNYKGLDRTRVQTVNERVRFSPEMDSLTDIKELQSIAKFKTQVWSFAPSNPEGLATTAGHDGLTSVDESYTGFDLRAEMVFAEDISTDQVAGDAAKLLEMLNTRAHDALANGKADHVVDGEVVPDIQYKYGVDYNLGDLVELQSQSGAIQTVRVTEYIRSQDSSGEKSYPTLTTVTG